MNKIEYRKIMQTLRNEGIYVLGKYDRIFPDCPTAHAQGNFILEVSVWVRLHSGTFDHAFFDAKCQEEPNFEMDVPHCNFYVSNNKSQKAFWDEVRAKLQKFESEAKLLKHFENCAGFKELPSLLTTFGMLENELEDGTQFEDYLERMGY